MTWFKVDDGFWSHPKTATLSDAAVTLWVRAGAYSCQHLTDGLVQRTVLRLVGTQDAADELVTARLWIETSDGWLFHDWSEYQETSDAVKKRREDARERQRRAREARENKRGESRVTDAVTNGVSSLPPTRPDPTRPLSTSNEVERPRSPFCEKHPNGTLDNCRACGSARMAFELGRETDRTRPTLIPPRLTPCEEHGHEGPEDGRCIRCGEWVNPEAVAS